MSEHKAGDSALIVRVEIALCAAAAMLLLWKGLIPAWRVLNTDFPNYYLVARLFHEGYSLDRIYDWVWLQRIKDHWGLDQPLVGFAGLTPLSALPIVPLTIFSALTAKRIWIIVNLAFLAVSAEGMHRSTSLGRRRIWLITLLAVLPLRTSFLYGQMHLLVLLLMVLAYFFYRRDHVVLCGLCIALAGSAKGVPPHVHSFLYMEAAMACGPGDDWRSSCGLHRRWPGDGVGSASRLRVRDAST